MKSFWVTVMLAGVVACWVFPTQTAAQNPYCPLDNVPLFGGTSCPTTTAPIALFVDVPEPMGPLDCTLFYEIPVAKKRSLAPGGAAHTQHCTSRPTTPDESRAFEEKRNAHKRNGGMPNARFDQEIWVQVTITYQPETDTLAFVSLDGVSWSECIVDPFSIPAQLDVFHALSIQAFALDPLAELMLVWPIVNGAPRTTTDSADYILMDNGFLTGGSTAVVLGDICTPMDAEFFIYALAPAGPTLSLGINVFATPDGCQPDICPLPDCPSTEPGLLCPRINPEPDSDYLVNTALRDVCGGTNPGSAVVFSLHTDNDGTPDLACDLAPGCNGLCDERKRHAPTSALCEHKGLTPFEAEKAMEKFAHVAAKRDPLLYRVCVMGTYHSQAQTIDISAVKTLYDGSVFQSTCHNIASEDFNWIQLTEFVMRGRSIEGAEMMFTEVRTNGVLRDSIIPPPLDFEFIRTESMGDLCNDPFEFSFCMDSDIPVLGEIFAVGENCLQGFTHQCGNICLQLSTAQGDPHFVGFHGGMYDIMGVPLRVHNIFTDTNLQVNARFVEYPEEPDATYMGEMGICVGKSRVFMDTSGVVSIEPLIPSSASNEMYFLDDGAATLTYTRNELVVTTDRWIIRARLMVQLPFKTRHIDISLDTPDGTLSKGPLPHGLLGQTTRTTKLAHSTGKQGEGVIEGAVHDYLVDNDDIWGTSFRFNLFQED